VYGSVDVSFFEFVLYHTTVHSNDSICNYIIITVNLSSQTPENSMITRRCCTTPSISTMFTTYWNSSMQFVLNK